MSVEKIDTLVVGAGQAGIALCEHLGDQGIPHLVLEKNRIAEAWRTSRWGCFGDKRSGMARPVPQFGVYRQRAR